MPQQSSFDRRLLVSRQRREGARVLSGRLAGPGYSRTVLTRKTATSYPSVRVITSPLRCSYSTPNRFTILGFVGQPRVAKSCTFSRVIMIKRTPMGGGGEKGKRRLNRIRPVPGFRSCCCRHVHTALQRPRALIVLLAMTNLLPVALPIARGVP